MVANSGRVGRDEPLGIYTKFGTPPPLALEEQVKEARRRRYRLQDRARLLLRDERRIDRNGQFAPYRVTNCLRAPSWQTTGASIARTRRPSSADGGQAGANGCGRVVATYRGMQVCGSIWHCPVCAARIANERRRELRTATLLAERKGYKAVLVTLTARHDASTRLSTQVAKMTAAHRRLWKGAPARRLRERYGVLGMVRDLETTHSQVAGWHTHIHTIIYLREGANVEAFGQELRVLWERAAAAEGLTMNEHGFHIMDSSARVAEYVAKWGREPRWREADELARWHTKKGRETRRCDGHYSPWQLLEFADAGDVRAGELWKEYALVFYKRKQLHWSEGLREALGMGKELSDQEAAEREMEEATEDYVLSFTEEQWGYIKGNDLRVEMLELVEQYEAADVVEQCQARYGLLPTLQLPGVAASEEDGAEDARLQHVAELVATLKTQPERKVMTPAGVAKVGTLMYFEKLGCWRCSVWLDVPDKECRRYHHYDLEELRLAA